MFDEQFAAPEKVDAAIGAADALDGFLESGDAAALEAEDFEELIPKGLLLANLRDRARPVFGETNGPVPDFIPGNRHGSICNGFSCATRHQFAWERNSSPEGLAGGRGCLFAPIEKGSFPQDLTYWLVVLPILCNEGSAGWAFVCDYCITCFITGFCIEVSV